MSLPLVGILGLGSINDKLREFAIEVPEDGPNEYKQLYNERNNNREIYKEQHYAFPTSYGGVAGSNLFIHLVHIYICNSS